MNEISQTLIILGVLFLIGFITHVLGRRTPLPRVTLLLLSGFVIGPSGLDLFPDLGEKLFPLVSNMALVMIGFILGEKFTLSFLREHGKVVMWMSVAEVIATATIVLAGLLIIGIPLEIAILLAGIATATDPAATTDVINENKSDGPFTRTLLGIVAVDDAWGLILFSFMLAVASALNGQAGNSEILLHAAWDIGGAVILGIILGVPMAYLTGRIKPGQPTLAEALGFVFLCGGIALWIEVSYLLASMILGMVVANLARHHKRPFHAIEGVEWPFMILFFILAGFSLNIESISVIGLVGTAYVILRIIGRFAGAWLGGYVSNAGPLMRRWMGMALMPQAGVAMGMALISALRFPDLGEIILPVIVAATVLFELIGPVLTRKALLHAGEVPDRSISAQDRS